MPDKLVWIAKNEGWTSNRTRDLVDVSFTIIKESVDRHAELIVRSTYYSDPKARARWVIGRMYFDTAKKAKTVAQKFVDDCRDTTIVTNKSSARIYLLNGLLNSSDSAFSNNPKFSGLSCTGSQGFARIGDDIIFAEEVLKTPKHTTTLLGSATAHGYPKPSSIHYIDLSKMIESVELEVKPVFDPKNWRVGDAVPDGYLAMGKTLVAIAWPK